MRVSGQMFRRLIPALGVTGVIVLAALAPMPTLASSTNNCGVKGYGYHDHGKVCPNRPFPGHGKGVIRILSGVANNNSGAVGRGKSDQKKGSISLSISATSTSESAKTGTGTTH